MMILIKEVTTLRKQIETCKQSGKTIGFVPTMGALHDGHISLLNAAKEKADIAITSIFVNPTQFNDPADYQKYPVTLSDDILLLEKSGCDLLFLPTTDEMYPEGMKSAPHYNLGDLEHLLEGKYRPGHFQGVCQVVHKLLQIVAPHFIFMGQKDYQQCLIVRRLVSLYNLPVELIVKSTYREPSGLAMSSRNLRLSPEQQQKATGIFLMLMYIKDNFLSLPLPQLQQHVTEYLLDNGFQKVDYVSIADAHTLISADGVVAGQKLVALIAAFISDVRLIDNLVLTD